MGKSRKGFTLVELMVVLVILALIVVGVFSVVITQNKAYHSEEDIIDMQMNSRVAMNRITRLIRMAGFGCQENISSGINGFTTVITATNSSAGPDTLTLVSGYRRVGVVTDTTDADGDGTDTPNEEYPPSTTIKVTTDRGSLSTYFDDTDPPNSKKYFYISPASSKGFLTIASGGVDDTNKTLTKNGGKITVHEGDIVYTVKAYTISIKLPAEYSNPKPPGPNLVIDENTGGNRQDFAENIEDLQFQYGWDVNGDGRITASEWVDNPAGSEDQVRAVRIQILARSAQPDRDFIDLHDDDGATAGKQYTIADHSITLNSNSEHFHRYLTETIVFIRNLNF